MTRKDTVQFLMHAIGRLPLRVHYFNSVWIAFLLERVFRYRRRTVEQNLFFAFPEMSEKERVQVRHQFYRHLTRLFLETLWFGSSRSTEQLIKSGLVRVTNPEQVNSMYEASPSMMVMCAHTGNWELIGGIASFPHPKRFCFDENDVVVVYRKLSNAIFDAIFKENRTARMKMDPKEYTGAVESLVALRYVIRHYKEKKVYCFITDQRPYVSVETAPSIMFMHRECRIMQASAVMAQRFSMSVMYCRMREESIGHYTMEFVPICDDASKMPVDDIMKRYFQLLEEDLHAQPYNYLWTHNRWWQP